VYALEKLAALLRMRMSAYYSAISLYQHLTQPSLPLCEDVLYGCMKCRVQTVTTGHWHLQSADRG